jgi:hypothetical protein
MTWLGIGLIVLAIAIFGGSRMNVRNSKGNFVQNTRGNVTQTYTETGATPGPPESPSFQERLFTWWAPVVIGIAGVIVAIIYH